MFTDIPGKQINNSTLENIMANVGYRRVSSTDQNTDRQLDGLTFDKEFSDKASAGTTNRPGLRACLEFIREWDTLHVHSIDRLCRNLADLQGVVTDLTEKGITIHFHKENLIFTGEKNPMNTLTMQLLGAVAEFEKALINERQREGIAAARAKGKHLGRAAKLTPQQVQMICRQIADGSSVADLAEEYGVSRQTIYKSIERIDKLDDSPTIACKICGSKAHYIELHLSESHNLTLEDYLKSYEHADIMSNLGAKLLKKRTFGVKT